MLLGAWKRKALCLKVVSNFGVKFFFFGVAVTSDQEAACTNKLSSVADPDSCINFGTSFVPAAQIPCQHQNYSCHNSCQFTFNLRCFTCIFLQNAIVWKEALKMKKSLAVRDLKWLRG
jgi:hypothetical protein